MANGLDEFNLQLSGELDQQQSKKNINDDIATLERAIEHLKVQAEIDPNSVKNIAKQLSDILNQKVVVDNIQIDATKVSKTAQQVGQKIGDAVEKTVQQSLSIDDVIDKQVTDLMAKYSIAGKKGSKAFEEIRQAVVNYRKELATVDSAFDSDDIFDIFSNSADIRKVTSALTDHMKVADATKDTYASLAEYIKHVNNSGTKIHLPESIRQEYGDDFSSMRSQLGKAFTTGQGGDFESFITELNGQLGNVIDMSQGAEAAFGDLVQKVNSAKGGNFLSGDELFKQGYLDRNEIERDITSAIDIIEEEEKKLAQTSTAVANTVVQNEQKKQQAYQQTAKAQSSVDNPDLDMSGNAQKIEQFKESLAELGTVDSKYVDRLSERFENLGIQIQTINASLSEVAVHEKGEYKGTKEILSSTLTGIDKYGQAITLTEAWDLTNHEFVKSLDAVGSSFDNVQKHVTTYQAKLNDLKTKYSNASLDYSGFETALANFQKGIGTVDDLKLAFNELENSAKLGVQSLKSQSSSFDPIQQALNNMRDMPSMLKTLEASMSGVKDKTSLAGISVKDLTSKYEELQKEMTANGGKVLLTDQWTQDYRELMSTVTSVTKQVDALKKAEASDNSRATKQANYYSSILASYRQMYDIKKKLLSAGEEETKVLESQRKSLSASIASNYKQLGKQGLTDKDWQSQVDALKKEQEYQLNLTQARISDKNAIQEQTQAQRDYSNALKEQEALQKNLDRIQLQWGDGSYEAKYDSLIAKTKQWVDANDESVISTQKLTQAYNEFNTAASNFAKDGSVANRDLLIQKEEELGRQLKATTNDIKIQNAEWAKSSKVDSLHQKIQEFYDKNTATHRTWGAQLRNLLDETSHGAQVTATRVNEIEQEFLGVSNAARQAGKLGLSFFDSVKEQGKKFIQWFSITDVIMESIQTMKKMADAVYEIDTAMTNLYKVTDETGQRYDKFLDSATGKAQELGRTVSSLVEQTANWSKLGFSLDEAEKLAELSSIYANVAEVSDDTAVSDMVTAMKAFNIEASDAITIVDMLNTLGNKYATSAADLGTGLSKSASAMATAGTSIEKTLAMLTGGAEITQSADEFGNMLKVGSMRIRGMKGELEALGEEVDENVESISKMQTQVLNLTHGKVNIFDDNGEFKDYYDIMEGVAKIYSDLSSTEQASLSEILFGKQRGNQGAALIQAFQSGQIQKAYEDIQDSAGSAYEEQARWMESLEADFASLYRNMQLEHI